MSALAIRDARPADVPAIESVTLAAYQQYATQLPPPFWEAYRANITGTLADVTPAAQLVAEREGRIVGTVLLYPAGAAFPARDGAGASTRWPEVRLLAVDPAESHQLRMAFTRLCVFDTRPPPCPRSRHPGSTTPRPAPARSPE